MKTAKVLKLGAALLAGAVWLAAPALAEDAAEMAPETEATQAAAPGGVAAAVEGAGVSEVETAPDGQGEGVAADAAAGVEAPSGEAVEAADAQAEPTPVAEEKAGHQVQLGAVGYDSEGRQGRVHVVVVGDTLWDISDAYLGTPWVWPSIWRDNQDIENPHLIYPGDHIWITPNEMRRISGTEAEALLSGSPASPEDDALDLEAPTEVASETPAMYPVANRETVGMLDTEQVEAAGTVVAGFDDRMHFAQMDKVYISQGEGEAEVGDQYTIFETKERVYDPDTNDFLGYHVEFHGWAEVVEVGEDTSLAEIRQSSEEIQLGDRIIPRPPPIYEVSPQPAPDVDGQIAFLPQSRTVMGSQDYVYLNRGTLDGLEVGSPLIVYRPGYETHEELRGSDVRIDDRVMAQMIVVRVRDESSVALVKHTDDTLQLGDHFRGGN